VDIYTTEAEQVERIKKWLKEYAPTIIISLLIVVVGTFGWRYWNQRNDQFRATASNTYEQLLSSTMNNTPGSAALAEIIIKNYKSTPYAKLAALLLAKQDITKGEMANAIKQLQWVMQQNGPMSIKQVARDRLARVYISENKASSAITVLQTINDKAYLIAINAIRGDAYTALGDTNKARLSYQAALTMLPISDDSRPLLEMKLNDLPASV
jgi:predicted negative regulator of RcsB-dependent stress response